jgi:hypothetical protein
MENTLTKIQSIYFDVTDLLNNQSYQSIGYANKKEMLLDFKEKLEDIEIQFLIQIEKAKT